jgi:hypothetical protein
MILECYEVTRDLTDTFHTVQHTYLGFALVNLCAPSKLLP